MTVYPRPPHPEETPIWTIRKRKHRAVLAGVAARRRHASAALRLRHLQEQEEGEHDEPDHPGVA